MGLGQLPRGFGVTAEVVEGQRQRKLRAGMLAGTKRARGLGQAPGIGIGAGRAFVQMSPSPLGITLPVGRRRVDLSDPRP